MPELPEVEGLALDLSARLADRAIARVDVAAFSALKTFDPPLSALTGTLVEGVTRHGKFLDIDASGLHLVLHLARAGWVRWRDEVPRCRPSRATSRPSRRGSCSTTGPASTSPRRAPQEGLALYVVRDPQEVPGIASLGPDPLDDAFTVDGLQGRSSTRPVARRSRACCATRARSPASATPTPTSSCTPRGCPRSSPPPASTEEEVQTLYDAIRTVLGDAVERSRGLPPPT